MRRGTWGSSVGALLALVVTAGSLGGGVMAARAWAQELPSATVKVWDTAVPVGGLSLGLTPGESVEDPMGQTGHGTSFPTIVTVYANGSHPLGPSGVSYWNPDGNLFVWYGKTIGFPGGVDINRSAPPLAATSSVFGNFTFGPGDVWIGGQQNEPVYVQLAGNFTDMLGNEVGRFRTYGTDKPLVASAARAWGMKVDQTTGHVFLSQPGEGRITRLDPVTAGTTLWSMGGGPAGITLDAAGRPYTTLSRVDAVLRVDPGPDGILGVLPDGTTDDFATFWRVPNLDGIRSFRDVPPPTLEEEYPNAIITTDANGNVWFTESNSHEIGRLGAGPDGVLGTGDDEICEYRKEGLLNPQQIASSGAGDFLQVYFTEGEGNSVSVLTEVEADMAGEPTRICTTVPAEQLVPPNLSVFRAQTVFFDEEVVPLRTPIVPTVHEVQGLDGDASGMTTTADGKVIPPILRFSPMPNPLLSADGTPIGDAGNGFPSGMTGVYATSRVAGAHLKGNKHFEVTSGAIIGQPPPPPAEGLPGRMTGGGRAFTADGTRVTHGMVLQCVISGDGRDRRNALQANWGDGHRFHLTRITSAFCSDDPSIDPGQPPAPFDTHTGGGTGRYDGVDGATVEWTFTDAGEPGVKRDRVRMVIRDNMGIVVLTIDAVLDGGNHQAHAEVNG